MAPSCNAMFGYRVNILSSELKRSVADASRDCQLEAEALYAADGD